jgi:hypothetical protein
MIQRESGKWLRKKAKLGNRGYPTGVIAFYGPDDRRASKVAASVILVEGGEATFIRRWFDDEGDLRRSGAVLEEASSFFKSHAVRSIAMFDRIIGCPHEEGVDYEGETCPACPFWADRDRWTGELKRKQSS